MTSAQTSQTTKEDDQYSAGAHRFSPEQQAVVVHTGNLLVNACAGAGKTTTLVGYAAHKTRIAPAGKPPRILYLAFNRSVRLEAQHRFALAGLPHVEVHTAHSLAYKHIFRQGGYSLMKGADIRVNDIIDAARLAQGHSSKVALGLATHVKKLLSMFCNSAADSIHEIDYVQRSLGEDKPVHEFVTHHRLAITDAACLIFARWQNKTLDITHDFYLKQFQLSKPRLAYDYILFDEGQDASGSMLDVFFAQKATKVIVGDDAQQIYGFRYAVNSLGMADYPTLNLTSSYRFGQPIAELANAALNWKKVYRKDARHSPIEGLAIYTPPADGLGINAVIGRTNMAILADTIESLCVRQEIGSVYYEGRFENYTYMDQGGSLMDIYHLNRGRLSDVRSPVIRQLGSIGNLKEYIEATGESSMKLALQIVDTYKDDLPDFIDAIKDAHMPDAQRCFADSIYTTVHRAKGLEYDDVRVCDDFIDLGKVIGVTENLEKTDPAYAHKVEALNEEINMLYVAVTRSKNKLTVPVSLSLRPEAAKK